MNLKNKNILLTGGSGFLGQYVFKELIKKGVNKNNIYIPRSKDCDLRILENVKKVVKGKDIIIHLAGIVGGIGFNRENHGRMFYDNMLMGLNLFEQARLAQVKKFVTLGTVCSYPKYCPIPFKEKDLWNGYPEDTNAPYGLAKKMLLVLSQAYRKQYNFNSVFLIPVNLYGPGDNFDLQSSHVIPALIRKIDQAKTKKKNSVVIWGSGKASREFLYVEDCARAIIMATENYNKSEPVNIGTAFEIKIKELAELIAKIMNYKGKLVWDQSKPDGQPRRCVSVKKAYKEFRFKAYTKFKAGLKETIKWYLKKYAK